MRALLWLLLLPLSMASATEHWQQESYLANSFLTVALKREYQPGAMARLTRWEQPVRYFLINESGDLPLQQEVVRVQLEHLSRITGVPVQPVSARESANLVIVMTRQAEIPRWAQTLMGQGHQVSAALGDGLCLGQFKVGKRGALSRASVLIPTDRARDKGRFLDCVVEEITQVMGLPNDSDQVFPSVFNDHSIDSFLSPLDYLLLRILYAPELKSGMDVKAVQKALPAVLARLRQEGEIDAAPLRVQAGSLKQWAGM